MTTRLRTIRSYTRWLGCAGRRRHWSVRMARRVAWILASFLCFASTVNAATPMLAGGASHTVGLKADGTVWAWGYNGDGELGTASTIDSFTPVQVRDAAGAGFISGVQAGAVGSNHTLALKADGTVWAWGLNDSGQIGDGAGGNRTRPVQVRSADGASFLTGVKAVAAGYHHSVALKSDGTVWAWGYNGDGALGNGGVIRSHKPGQVR